MPVNGEADTGQNTQCPSDAPGRWPMPAQPARSSEACPVTATAARSADASAELGAADIASASARRCLGRCTR